jgi:hypothetical protein
MTAVPDHRPGHVVLACTCGTVLSLPPVAAEAARPRWEAIHRGPGHGPADVPAKVLVPAAGNARRS